MYALHHAITLITPSHHHAITLITLITPSHHHHSISIGGFVSQGTDKGDDGGGLGCG